jgi:thymidylate kinase
LQAADSITADDRTLKTDNRASVRRRRGAVVALSGLDGSGKTSQARALKALLEGAGYEVAYARHPFADQRWVFAVSHAARGVVRGLRRLPGFGELAEQLEESGSPLAGADAARPGRLRRVLTDLWTVTLACSAGAAQGATARRHVLRGRIVIFDRYALDSTVRLSFVWGAIRPLRLQRWLVRALPPRPAAAFLLDVPGGVALARKEDGWSLGSLDRMAVLYRAESARLGVRRLDGERPQDELSQEIAAEVRRALAC